MKDFEYFAPASLEEAAVLLNNKGLSIKVLAGGTDLIAQMKDKRIVPDAILDVKHIPELNRLETDADGTLHIGAAVPLSKIVAFPPMREKFGMLYQGCSLIGSLRIRNRATMGGNICNAAPSADSAAPLLCLGARANVMKSGGNRSIPIEQFFVGPGQTALEADELLVSVDVPAPPESSAGSYLRHTPREEMDIAVVGGASFLVMVAGGKVCREARIALGAVAETPIRVPEAEKFLADKIPEADVIEEAALLAANAASPISDVRSSAEYRRELVKVIVRRTLQNTLSAINT